MPALQSLTPAIVRAQNNVDRIHGTVLNSQPKPAPIADAEITALRGPDRQEFSARSDSSGQYELRIPAGTGDYLLTVSAVGFAPVRRRVSLQPGSVAIADFSMIPMVMNLGAVTVHETATEPVTVKGLRSTIGSSDAEPNGFDGAVGPTRASSIAALVQTIPSLAGDGTLLGAAGGLVSLNGLATSARSLPRGMQGVTITGASSPYAVSTGGVAGAHVRLEIAPGQTEWNSTIAGVALSPSAASTADRLASEAGAVPDVLQLGLAHNGELIPQRLWVNAGIQFQRERAPLLTLARASPTSLAAYGTSAGAIDAISQRAAALHVPLNAASRWQTRQDFTALARIDSRPFPSTSEKSLLAQVSLSADDGLGSDVLRSSTTRRTGRYASASLQGNLVTHFDAGKQWLVSTRVGMSLSVDEITPQLRGPEITILGDAREGSLASRVPVVFGGTAETSRTKSRLEATHDQLRQVQIGGVLHKLRLATWSRLDVERANLNDQRFGQYQFASLADFNDGRPASFSSLRAQRRGNAAVWNGALGLGDEWMHGKALSILVGTRLESWSALQTVGAGLHVDSLLSLSSDAMPRGFGVSPRIAFRLRVAGESPNGGSAGTMLSATGRRSVLPAGVITGGVGLFRGLLATDDITQASALQGNDSGVQRQFCLGADLSRPDWEQIFANPEATTSACLPNGMRSDLAPPARLIARDAAPPASWRGNLQYVVAVPRGVLRFDALLNLAHHQPSFVDVNFRDVASGVLASERNRPVYFEVSAVDTGTGVANAAASRRASALGPVLEWRTDLASRGAQVGITFDQSLSSRGPVSLQVSYWLASVRQQLRGFDGGAFGSPLAVEWGPAASDARHRVQIGIGGEIPVGHGASLIVTGFLRAESGRPITPLVGGDITGSGAGTQRAYLPTNTENPALSASLAAFSADLSRELRNCITRSTGILPQRGACRGPWTSASSLQFRLQFPSSEDWGDSPWTVALHVANPLAAVDRLLHGATSLRGWGQPFGIDEVLLRPTGFDASARKFRYALNTRFGRPAEGVGAIRAPAVVTLDVSRAIGPRYRSQQLARLVRPSSRSGKRPGADSIFAALTGFLAIRTPWAVMLEQQDWLLLSPEQVVNVQRASAEFAHSVRGMFEPAIAALIRGDGGIDGTSIAAEVLRAKKRAYELFWDASSRATKMLSPPQLAALDEEGQMILSSGARKLYLYGL